MAKLFDFGATKIDKKPSKDELFIVGQLLAQAYSSVTSNNADEIDVSKYLSSQFIQAINEFNISGKENTGYLTSVHKAWLALADFRRDFTKDDYKNMFVAVLKSKRVDPKVFEGIQDQMGMNSFAFKTALKLARTSIKFS